MLVLFLQTVFFTVMARFSPESSLETAILDKVEAECPVQDERASRDVLLKVLRTEETFGVPNSMRGMTLAAACVESKLNPNAEGDHKFSRSKKKPVAIGLFQLWPWYARHYQIDRRDPVASAHAWLSHIHEMVPRVRSRCRLTDTEEIWATAWITGVLAPGNYCGETISHYRVLREWRGAWTQDGRVSIELTQKDTAYARNFIPISTLF